MQGVDTVLVKRLIDSGNVTEALRQVAARISNRKQLQPLRHELAAMTAAHAEGDAEAFMEANYRYRAAWLSLVPNQRLLRAIELYADHVRYLRALTLGDRDTRKVVLRGLERLAATLAVRDVDATACAMRSHLSAARRVLHRLLGEQHRKVTGRAH